MTTRRLNRMLAVCVHFLVLTALGVLSSITSAADSRPAAPSGSIGGRVRYIGRAPDPVYVFESGASQTILAVAKDQGLSSAVAYVSAPATPAVDEALEVVVNQRNWWFTPGMVSVRSGQPVRFTNDDPSNHNVRSTHGVPANRFSAYTGTGQPYVHRFRTNPDHAPVVLTCDIHAWMMAWIYVFDHPHFAMTNQSGEFALQDLAPGTYRLSIRHGPSGLAKDLDVTVAGGRESRVEVSFDTPDLKLPSR